MISTEQPPIISNELQMIMKNYTNDITEIKEIIHELLPIVRINTQTNVLMNEIKEHHTFSEEFLIDYNKQMGKVLDTLNHMRKEIAINNEYIRRLDKTSIFNRNYIEPDDPPIKPIIQYVPTVPVVMTTGLQGCWCIPY
jgi:hypothetical protein